MSMLQRVSSLFLLCLLFGTGLGSPVILAQSLPEFDVDYVSKKSDRNPDRSRIDLFTRIGMPQLRFYNKGGQFQAHYEVTVDIFETNTKGEPVRKVITDNWDRTVTARNYEETQNEKISDTSTHAMELFPGQYLCQVTIEDSNSEKTVLREFQIKSRNFGDTSKTGLVSDLLLVDEYNASKGSLTPNVQNIILTDRTEATFFFEVYTPEAGAFILSYNVQQLRNTNHRPSVRNLLNFKPNNGDLETVGVSNWSSKPLRTKAGDNPAVINLPLKDLKAGSYVVNVLLKTEGGETLDAVAKVIGLQWTGLDAQIQDLESAIAQLRYIAKDQEINTIKRQPSPEKKQEAFTGFWRQRDPSPGTRRNEAMEEYYYRIFQANKNYRQQTRSGWDTDMGEVYVRFGEPSFIQRQPMDFGRNRSYQIWYYENIGKKFIFIDQTGFGDYRLLRPIWDERNRM